MSIPSPLQQYHFHVILIWWHSPFKWRFLKLTDIILYVNKTNFSFAGSNYSRRKKLVARHKLTVMYFAQSVDALQHLSETMTPPYNYILYVSARYKFTADGDDSRLLIVVQISFPV